MRHRCRSCQRVFHLDAGASTPCPYCGGVLAEEKDLFGDAPAETFLTSSEDLDLNGRPAAGSEKPRSEPGVGLATEAMSGVGAGAGAESRPRPAPTVWPQASEPSPLPTDPPRPSGVPSPTSMITSDLSSPVHPDSYGTELDAGGPASGQDDGRPPKHLEGAALPGEVAAGAAPGIRGEATRIGTMELGRAARTGPDLFRGAPTATQPAARPPAATGKRTAVAATVAAVLGLAAGAGAMALVLYLYAPRAESNRVVEAEQRAAELDRALKSFKAERDEVLGENRKLQEEKRALVVKLDKELAAAREGAGTVRDGGSEQAAPGHAEAVSLTLRSVKLLERRADLEGALAMAAAAVGKDPALASAHRVKGRVLAALGRAAEALDAFEAASEAGDAESLVLAGEVCLTDLGDRDRAAGYYAKAAELETGAALGLVAEARALQLKGDYKSAVVKSREAAKADPALALAPLVTGEIALELALGKKGSTREKLLETADRVYLAKAVKLDPNSARACLMRGRALLERSKLRKAERGLGLARFETQGEAARLLARAAELAPGLAEAHMALAELRLDKGALRDPALAVKLAEDAVRLTSRRNVDALVTLASARAASGDPSRAAGVVEEALKLAPMKAELRSVLARYKAEAQAIAP